MRTSVAALLLAGTAALAAGCGDDPATDPAAPDAATPDGPHLDRIVAISGVGGRVSPRAVVLSDEGKARRFVKRFDDPDDIVQQLGPPVAEAEEDGVTLAAAVVSIDCEVPPGVEITETGRGLEVVAEPLPEAGRECLVPVTSIALVVVPD